LPIVDVAEGVTVQEIEVDTFVPFPSNLEPDESWASVLTKTSGDGVGAEACRACGNAVALRIRFAADNRGCFFEETEIGTMGCAF
jgi:hypothetical protein